MVGVWIVTRWVKVSIFCDLSLSSKHNVFQDSVSDHHHHQPKFEQRGPDDGDVAATFVFEEEEEQARERSSLSTEAESENESKADGEEEYGEKAADEKSSASTPPTTRSRRPTGMPYVLADQAIR